MVIFSDLLRGAADFIDAVNEAQAERRSGFSEREAGDYLDGAALADAMVPDEFADDVATPDLYWPADFDAMTAASVAVREWIDDPDYGRDGRRGLIGCTPAMIAGIAVNAYRAALMSVSHEDLAAHIAADMSQQGCLRPTEAEPYADSAASSLLDDFHITKK